MKFPWSKPEPEKKYFVRVSEVCFGGSLYYEVRIDGMGFMIDPQRRFWENKDDAIKVAKTIAAMPKSKIWEFAHVSYRDVYTCEYV